MKAVLVMDMPDGCGKCKMRGKEWNECCLNGEDTFRYDNKRPDFCPLRPMPENKHGYMGADDSYEEGYGYGFNDCLKAIEGSGEDV